MVFLYITATGHKGLRFYWLLVSNPLYFLLFFPLSLSRSFSTASNHSFLGLPLLFLFACVLFSMIFTTLLFCNRDIRPNQRIRCDRTPAEICRLWYISIISWLDAKVYTSQVFFFPNRLIVFLFSLFQLHIILLVSQKFDSFSFLFLISI